LRSILEDAPSRAYGVPKARWLNRIEQRVRRVFFSIFFAHLVPHRLARRALMSSVSMPIIIVIARPSFVRG